MRWMALILAALILLAEPGVGLSAVRPEWGALWVPLDSRPVNTAEVALFGAAVNGAVRLPPSEHLDWYASRRADTRGLLAWVRQSARPGELLVLSTNTLLTGGLIASRDPAFYSGVEERLAALRATLSQLPPGRRIAVHVLPRAWPTQFRADGTEEPGHSKLVGPLLERTELQHKLLLHNRPADRQRLAALERTIPVAARTRQDELIAQNSRIIEALLDWTAAGLLDELVVGLDDARPLGMANWLHQQAAESARERGLGDRVQIHYGADELGFLLLAREALLREGVQPRIAVSYDLAGVEQRVLPYEGSSLERSVDQKLTFLGVNAQAAGRGQRLFLYTTRTEEPDRLADQMATAQAAGEQLALADVTGTGGRDRRLVEALSRRVNLERVAYAGWNTASNAAGTALAMAAVRELHGRVGASGRERLALQSFQTLRYAHDLIFQAHREELALWARRQGINPNQFGPGRDAMARHLRSTVLSEARAWLKRYYGGGVGLADATFPWERCFEADFRPLIAVEAPEALERQP